jgi:tetratricopeptide (TPR) repeat protein
MIDMENLSDAIRTCEDLLASEQVDQAKSKVIGLLDRFPDNAKLLIMAISIHESSKETEQCIIFSETLLKHHPNRWEGYAALARCKAKLNLFADAAKTLDDGLQALPDTPKLLQAAIEIFRLCGQRDQSLKCAQNLIRVQPKNKQAYCYAAQDLIAHNRFSEAIESLDEGLAKATNPASLNAWRGAFAAIPKLYEQGDPLCKVFLAALCAPQSELPTPISPIKLDGGESPLPQPIQYWSQGQAPAEIQDISNLWDSILRDYGLASIQHWNRIEALDWISDHTPQFKSAFITAPNYASESDIFRLAFASLNSCIWLDSDLYPTSQTTNTLNAALGKSCSTLLCAARSPYILNSFFIARKDCPIFKKCASDMSGYTFDGKQSGQNLTHTTFGPHLYTKVLRSMFRPEKTAIEAIDQSLCVDVFSGEKCEAVITHVGKFIILKKPGLQYSNDYVNWRSKATRT